MEYHTVYRACFTSSPKIRGYATRQKAERYARNHSDIKHGTVSVEAWIDDQYQGKKIFYNGELEGTEGTYA